MHPATENLLRWLTPNPSLPPLQKSIAARCYELAMEMVEGPETQEAWCAEGAELSTGLRKLLEAKDCFVRASLEEEG